MGRMPEKIGREEFREFYQREKVEDKMTLKDLKPGQSAVVKKLTRIMDMGLTKGAELLVRKVAPLGDPLELTVRGYELSVRKADAEMIEVELKN